MDEMIQRLRDTHAASTKGEWGDGTGSMQFRRPPYTVCCPHEGGQRVLLEFNSHFDSWADWHFVTLAHNAMPAILDRLAAAEARVKELEGALDECRAFVACHAVFYSFHHGLSKDGQTWHPEHKAFFDRISGLAAAARAEKEGERNAK